MEMMSTNMSIAIKNICNKIRNNEKINDGLINGTINKFKNEWINIMAHSNLYNKLNFTYSLNNIKFKDYGIECDIYIVPPLTYAILEGKIDVIQENLDCLIILNHSKVSKWIKARFIYNECDTKSFEKVPLKEPYMLYVGNDYSGLPILVNLKDYPHLLISGGTRSGKSKMSDCIITNSVINFSPQELQLYLCQAAKSDLILYEDLVHTRAYADTLEKIENILTYITKILMPERDKLIRPYRKRAKADNYHDYNKLKKTEKIPTTLIIFDEMSSLYQINGEGGDEKKLKQSITELIDRIAQYGASLGCFLISSVQRPTAKNLSSFVKSQSTANVSFKQNNSKSAEVATDDSKLPLGLKMREFVYYLDNWNYGIVPWINNGEIYELIKPSLDAKHRTLFDDLKKMNGRSGIKDKSKRKEKQEETHFKTSEEILEENISKINDFVTWDNPNGKFVIDGTKTPTKTKRPIKKPIKK